MSQIEKLLIPLIDDNITQKDVLSNKFVGIFTEDINMPGLDYIYLVYIYDMNDLHLSLAANSIDVVRRIGDELYHILKFPIFSTDLKKILCGDYNSLSNEGVGAEGCPVFVRKFCCRIISVVINKREKFVFIGKPPVAVTSIAKIFAV